MKSIRHNMENTIIINKSKFIGIIYHVNDKVEIINILMDMKKRYGDATHICYGYICGNLKNVVMMENLVVQLVYLF
ncbi:MAG: YigZ family protein [Bacilli bacterium]|nr:YigZ family protein [Bacilli bacterium]